MSTPFKMKPFPGFGNSPLNKKTEPMVPETTGDIGASAGDVETSYEEARRGLSPRGSVVDVLKARKKQEKRGYDKHGKKIKTKIVYKLPTKKTLYKLPVKK